MTTPRFAQKGEPGESFIIRLELKVLADIGLAGLPNAGKSTLLSVLTKAKPEIASYPFTTLAPNLGVLSLAPGKDLVIADIPGLIEHAHQGKGLGHEFLRHLERCQTIVYVIAPTDTDLLESDPDVIAQSLWDQYQVVKQELHEYQDQLVHKQAIVVVNKQDLLIPEVEFAIDQLFETKQIEPIIISAATNTGIEQLREKLTKLTKHTRISREEAHN